MQSGWIDFAAVGALGAMVGIGELVSRYRDEPGRIFRALAAWLYLGLNVGGAAIGMGLALAFDWRFGVATTSGDTALRWTRILVAGTAAMALLRSSLFTVRIGSQDVGIGPSSFLQSLLMATDRAVDRVRAADRNRITGELLAGISFAKACDVLPAHCLGLMQNLSKEEQEALGRQIAALKSAAGTDAAKSMLLGLALLNVVGETVLRDAIGTLKDQISVP
jgi:hypothetical protein